LNTRYTARIAACSLFQVGYDKLAPAIQAEMRGMFGQLCRDDTPMVRKAASASLGEFAAMVSIVIRTTTVSVLIQLTCLW